MTEMMWREDSLHREPIVTLSVVDGPHALARMSRVWSDRIRKALAEPVTEQTAAVLVAIPVRPLDEEGLLLRVQLADRVLAWAQAQAHIALADYAGPFREDRDRERHLRLEVRIARGTSDDAAGHDIDAARRLAGPCRPVRDLLEQGQIGVRHVWPVLNRTQGIDDTVTELAVEAVAPRMPRMAATRVGPAITTAVAKVDPRAQAARARTARRHNVGVSFRSLPDGLAQVTATHRVEDARAIMEIIDTAADRFLIHQGSCEPCTDAVPHEIGPARAAAHLAMVLRADDDADAWSATETAPAAGEDSAAIGAGAQTAGKRRRRGAGRVVVRRRWSWTSRPGSASTTTRPWSPVTPSPPRSRARSPRRPGRCAGS